MKTLLKRFWKWMLGLLVIPVAFAAVSLLPEELPSVTLENPQVIVWNKPTTDAGWAEDVKAAQLHMRSTAKLEEMDKVHTEKLVRVIESQREIIECPECIKFQAKRDNPEWTQVEIDAYYAEQLTGAYWEIENLTQGVERLQNELRLRRKGFVTVPSEELLGSVEQKYVRNKIID